MATLYALPSLATWTSTTGWSSTSGGASAGRSPTSTDDVVFDANSGPSRSINTSGGFCNNVSTVGANPMTFTSTGGWLQIFGSLADFTGSVSVASIRLRNGLTASSTGSASLKGQNVSFGTIYVSCSLTILSTLIVTTGLNFEDVTDTSSNGIPYNFTTNGFNITAPAVVKSNVGGGVMFVDNTTMTLTGPSYVSSLFSPGGSTITGGSSLTLKAQVAALTSDATITVPANATVEIVSTGTGGYYVVLYATFSSVALNSLTVQGGCRVKFQQGFTFTANNFAFNGTFSSPIVITSTDASTRASLVKSGGSTVYVDVCTYSCLNFSPANTFYARAGTDAGNSSGITVYKAKPNMFAYF